MSAIITRTSDDSTTSPTLVLGYETRTEGRSVVHDLIGGGVAVALVAPRPRAGTLSLFYPDEADAWAALALFRAESTFTLVSTTRPGVGMVFAALGSVLTLDDQTRRRWVLAVEYQELEP